MPDADDQSGVLHEGSGIVEYISEFVLSVIAAALVVSLIGALADQKSTTGNLIKLVGGVFLALTLLQGFRHINLDRFFDRLEFYEIESESAAAFGENISAESLHDIIKSKTESYILDKARLYRANLTVEVTLSHDRIPIPVSVRLKGNVSPFTKYQLQQLIENDLAISKEDQTWIE